LGIVRRGVREGREGCERVSRESKGKGGRVRGGQEQKGRE